jgi:hypothetical protein
MKNGYNSSFQKSPKIPKLVWKGKRMIGGDWSKV